MEIKVGDTIQVKYDDATSGNEIYDKIDLCMSEHCFQEWGFTAYRGTVVRIKTHAFWLFKLKEPVIYFTPIRLPSAVFHTTKYKKVIRC